MNDEYYTMDEFDSVVDFDYIEYLKKKNNETNGTDSDNSTGPKTDETTGTE